jgi:hypothetical protein
MKKSRGRHKRKAGMAEKNPYAKDLKDLEQYGKGLMKKKYDPVVKPKLVKVKKPKPPSGWW